MSRIFNVWCLTLEQEPEDGRLTKGVDEEDAATRWAEWHDISSAEYNIAGHGHSFEVLVQEGTEEPKKFVVTGESMPVYRARKK